MKAKCIKCKTIWEYEANEMKVELNGTGLIITLYCPKCHEQFYGYNPNELAFNMTPVSVDHKIERKVGYDWE